MADDLPDELAARRARKNGEEFIQSVARRLGSSGMSADEAVRALRSFQWEAVLDERVHQNCRCVLSPLAPSPWYRSALTWVRVRYLFWRWNRETRR